MKCECCGTKEDLAGVACSALGPVSLCYCRNCAENGAEPKDLIQFLIDDCGGLENIVEEFKESVTYFENGQYIKMKNFGSELPKGLSTEQKVAKHWRPG